MLSRVQRDNFIKSFFAKLIYIYRRLPAKRSWLRAKRYSFRQNIGKDCYFQKIVFFRCERKSVTIGDLVMIGRHTELHATRKLPIRIGNSTGINHRCIISPNTIIGNHVGVGPGVAFMTDSHEIGDQNKRVGTTSFPRIEIGDGCWIGANVTILGGVTIGAGTIIAAGALVNKNCEPNCLYGGVPAVLIKRLSD